ncbi:hypothetical protein C8U37_107109 [Trichococcus patagoniensis]|uniref:Uncharacterized protein n=1 Tax=Trichococcus patagoniensis TaxID=382641 RepID=A0A2T5ILQ3_9LACT|nr:hypothetical protein [Trichococcus patagoniensis]PTQ84741.1 hypothetical protein C8U37_107109 [Trichococcus patagoniensis]
MERTLLYYDLVLEKKRQINVFGDSTLKDEVVKFKKKATENDYTYLNRPDGVIIEVIKIDSSNIFGSYGRLANIDDGELIRSRNKDDYSFEFLETLIETYTYFLLNLEKNQIILLHNNKCGGFITYFSKFLREKFNLNEHYDIVSIAPIKDDNIREKLLQTTELDQIKFSYSSVQLMDNQFLTTNELYELDKTSIRNARVTLQLEPQVKNNKLLESLSSKDNISQQFNTFELSTNEGLIDLVEKKLIKKVSIKINEDEINNLDVIENLLSENLSSID